MVGRGAGRKVDDAVRGSAEIKAAKKLGVKPQTIVETAKTLWRRTLSEERDARTGLAEDARSLQARRGHISRELIEELRKEIERNMNKTNKTKRRRKK